jgi:hypothetical protein
MVGYYSFTIPANSDAILYGEIFINWIDSILNDSFVEEKAIISTRPAWAYGGQSEEAEFISGITFKYHSTEFVISTSKSSSSTTVYIYIYARNNRVSLSWARTNYISHNYSSDIILNYLIGQNSDYFIISHYNVNYYHFIVIKVDSPVNPIDTDLYVSILNSSRGTYNKSFDSEDIINIPVRFTLSTVINDYNSSFLVNYYNKKTELNNVYVYTPVHGVRGKINNLISLTRSRSTGLGTFYMINGVEYVGLNSLNDIISYGHTGILLKSY